MSWSGRLRYAVHVHFQCLGFELQFERKNSCRWKHFNIASVTEAVTCFETYAICIMSRKWMIIARWTEKIFFLYEDFWTAPSRSYPPPLSVTLLFPSYMDRMFCSKNSLRVGRNSGLSKFWLYHNFFSVYVASNRSERDSNCATCGLNGGWAGFPSGMCVITVHGLRLTAIVALYDLPFKKYDRNFVRFRKWKTTVKERRHSLVIGVHSTCFAVLEFHSEIKCKSANPPIFACTNHG